MIDQINELPEDGLKSSPERLHYIELHGLVGKKNKLYFSYTLLTKKVIHF